MPSPLHKARALRRRADETRTRLRTRAQLEAAYRVVFGRRPDEGGVAHFAAPLASGAIDLHGVVAEMVGSHEFRRAHPGLLADDPAVAVVDSGSFRIHVRAADHAVGFAMVVEGDYEPEVAAAISSVLSPGDTFVDVGANYGWHSLLAASIVGPTGRVVAIEPNPDNAALLARSVTDNGLTNVTVVVAAVADTPGWAALVTDGSNGWIRPLGPEGDEPVTCAYAVPVRRLDDIVAEAGVERVDVVKVDVEGNEPTVIRSGRSIFGGEAAPVLVTEYFPRLLAENGGSSAVAYLEGLRALGYEVEVVGRPGPASDADVAAATVGHDHIDLLCRPARRAREAANR